MISKPIRVTRDEEYGFDTEDGNNIEVATGDIFITERKAIVLALETVDDAAFASLNYYPKSKKPYTSMSVVYLGDVTHYVGHVDISNELNALKQIITSLKIEIPN
jgi:hypothetical protein